MSNWSILRDSDDLQSAIQQSLANNQFVLIFKHSTRCSLSSMVKNRLERNPNSQIEYFLVDVISNRSLSNQLSVDTGVQHESPQSFLYSNGKLIDVKSHSAIDPSELARRIQTNQ